MPFVKGSPIKRGGTKKYPDLERMGLATWKSPRQSCSNPGPRKTICALTSAAQRITCTGQRCAVTDANLTNFNASL